MRKKATEQWIAKQNEILPQCDYQHITYTMPAALWSFFKANRFLLNTLSTIAAKILLKIAKKKKIKIGIFTALHTFGRDLKWNVHIHLSVTRGGLSGNELTWKTIYFKKQSTMHMWRLAIIQLLRQTYKKGKLTIPEEYQSTIHHLTSLNRILNPEYQKKWHVHFAQPQKSHHHNVNYLGRYIKRPPLAQSRLLHYDGKTVVFRYLNHKTKHHELFRCTTIEFIQRLIQHIPKKSFKMIRYYGFLSFRLRGRLLPRIYRLLDQMPKTPKQITFTSLSLQFLRTDPFECILCGSRLVFKERRHKRKFRTL
ncbi:Putative transposase (plasmid) [Piscirickettsia salmonis]|uniref:IS91 family transposase n=2 Tax=Piscirickettsia salmonis TaxID=1238 RepID=UPI0012B717FB|nr:IS91 family transposase [Piscirickettsia salmonis]QGP52444.1 Putative transposase [Piscirickettsia salmonis]